MKSITLIAALLALVSSLTAAKDKPSGASEERLHSLMQFIESAPKATDPVGLSYAIKISQEDRRKAIRECQAIIDADRSFVGAHRLMEKLYSGEGPSECVASAGSGLRGELIPPSAGRVMQVLWENLIRFDLAGSRGVSISVSQSQADRASQIITALVMSERPPIVYRGSDGKWARSEPAEGARKY